MTRAGGASNDSERIAQLKARNAALEGRITELTTQLEWFKRQLFGSKSERRLIDDNPHQPVLDGFANPPEAGAPAPSEEITYRRRKPKHRGEDCVSEQGLRFDDSVPVQTIELSVPASAADDYEVIAEKVTHRLAQRPGSYVVLRYVRPVLKRKSDGAVSTLPAPDALWEGAMADVSVVAGILVDKFCYHLPLYRQHQRLAMSGITVARSTLSTWVHRACRLLEAIDEAQLRHILLSKTLAIDETSVRAGKSKTRGRMKTAWYWPVYGEDDEVAFTFSPTKGRAHLGRLLAGYEGTVLSDGASAYEAFTAERPGLVHAQCWNQYPDLGFIRSDRVSSQYS